MALIYEEKEINGKMFCVHSSDANFYIHKIGTKDYYLDAYDLIPCRYEYEESDKKIEKIEEPIVDTPQV